MEELAQGIKFAVNVVPKARSNEIVGWHKGENGMDELKIRITAAPDKGQANKAVIELLSKSLKVGKNKVTLLQGEKCRNKKFIIQGVTIIDIQNIS